MDESDSVFTVSGNKPKFNPIDGTINKDILESENNENQEQSSSDCGDEETITLKQVLHGFIKDISIEPVLFMRYAGLQIYTVIQQQFKLERFCFLNLNYTDEQCLNMNDGNHTDVLNDAQVLENAFGMYETIASTILPLIVVLFAGSWSDNHGRKIPICVNLAGFTLYMGVYILEAIFDNWSAKVLLVGEFLKGIGGGDMMFIMVYTSFLSDRTSTRDRLYRFGISMAVAHLGLPVGTAIGALIYEKTGYIWVFFTSFTLNIIAIIYMILFVKDISNSENGESKSRLLNIFNLNHPVDTIRYGFAAKPNRGRAHILILIIAMLAYTSAIQRNLYLWTMKLFNWSVKQFSTFQTFDQLYCQLMGLLISPLVGFLGIHDCDAAMGTIFFLMASNIWEGTLTRQDQGWAVYGATVIAFASFFPSSAIRSMISKITQEDTGKAFSLLAILESIYGLVNKLIYTAVYNATLETYPSAQSLVEAGFCVVLLTILGGLRISMYQMERKKRGI